MRLRAMLVLLALSMTLPAASAGAATIGSSAVNSPSGGSLPCSTSDPCLSIQDTIGGTKVRVPDGNWIVTSWRVRGATGSVSFVVIRPTGGTSDSLTGEIKATGPALAGVGGDSVQSQNVRMGASTGDLIGVSLGSGAAVGGLAAGTDTVLFEAPAQSPFSTSGAFNFEQLVQATIEPDADGDGYGDESQDGCPSSAATQGACPQPPAPPGPPDPLQDLRNGGRPSVKLASRRVGAPRGIVTVELVNPNGYAVKGTLTLKQKRSKVGSKRYSVPANESRKVKVKLAAKARRALRRAGRLKLSASGSVRGPIGAAGALRARLTVLKRAVRPPDGGGEGEGVGGTGFRGRTNSIDAQFTFDLIGGQIQNALGEIMVTCFYPDNTSRSAVEVWDPPGAFPLGQFSEQHADDKPSGILGSNVRKRYTMDASQSGDTITGTIQVSYAFTAYNPGTGMFQVSSCVGQDTFTARRG